MELRDLNAFLTVVDTGGFTRAAERLNLVQSAVSMAVKRLEREMDLVLLERRPGGAEPTGAGAALADHCRIIINSVARARQDMESYRGLFKGTVNIGIMPTATPLILAALLRRFRNEHPGLKIHVEESNARELLERVRLGEIDVAVLFLPAPAEELAVVELGWVELAVALPREHALVGRRQLRLASLAAEPWISFPEPSAGRRWLEEACAAAGFQPRVVTEVETLAQLKTFIEAGTGVGMLPAQAAAAEQRAGLLHVVRMSPLNRVAIGYAYDPRHPSRSVAAVREALEIHAKL